MNSFDIAVFLGLAIAMGTGFSTGLIRSAITIVAYIVAMPVTVWVMSYVPPLTENTNSPLMQNAGFLPRRVPGDRHGDRQARAHSRG